LCSSNEVSGVVLNGVDESIQFLSLVQRALRSCQVAFCIYTVREKHNGFPTFYLIQTLVDDESNGVHTENGAGTSAPVAAAPDPQSVN